MGKMAQYEVQACSTETFGRVLCSARNHHFVADGPTQNGCPGEAITPAELFLSSLAACGVELLQVIARKKKLPLAAASVEISGMVDRSQQARADVTVFNSIRLQFLLKGVTDEQGAKLIATFQSR
jgi:uncharacterized OsmC-like protein